MRLVSIVSKLINKIQTKVNRYNFLYQKVSLGKNYIFHGHIYVRNFGIVKIGDQFKASSGIRYNPIGGDTILRIICLKDARIIIGDNVGISNSTLHIKNELIIGNNVMIGGGCKIWDSDFHSHNYRERILGKDINVPTKPIHIGENAFIGACTIILKGVKIGKNSIIGAGSVVTKSIPDNEIWAGNPAKKIREITEIEY